jgi:hypothetical protein
MDVSINYKKRPRGRFDEGATEEEEVGLGGEPNTP